MPSLRERFSNGLKAITSFFSRKENMPSFRERLSNGFRAVTSLFSRKKESEALLEKISPEYLRIKKAYSQYCEEHITPIAEKEDKSQAEWDLIADNYQNIDHELSKLSSFLTRFKKSKEEKEKVDILKVFERELNKFESKLNEKREMIEASQKTDIPIPDDTSSHFLIQGGKKTSSLTQALETSSSATLQSSNNKPLDPRERSSPAKPS